jgi:hypothetical protein
MLLTLCDRAMDSLRASGMQWTQHDSCLVCSVHHRSSIHLFVMECWAQPWVAGCTEFQIGLMEMEVPERIMNSKFAMTTRGLCHMQMQPNNQSFARS